MIVEIYDTVCVWVMQREVEDAWKVAMFWFLSEIHNGNECVEMHEQKQNEREYI